MVQFRSNRIRIETAGDAAEVSILAAGPCAASDIPSINFVSGHANVFLSGTTTSITTSGSRLTFGPLLFPGLTLEAGVVVAQDADRNVLEIVWPGLAGLPPGPPILRLQLAKWNNWVRTGRSLDVTMRFNARGPDGSTASYDVRERTRRAVPALIRKPRPSNPGRDGPLPESRAGHHALERSA